MPNFARLSKSELINWGKSLKEDASAKSLDVNALCESRVKTLMTEKRIDPKNFSFRNAFEAFVNPDNTLNLANPIEVGKAVESSLYPRITAPMVASVIQANYDYEVGDLTDLFIQEDAEHTATADFIGLNSYGDLQRRRPGEAYERSRPEDESFKAWFKDYGLIIDLTIEDIMDDKNNLLVRKVSDGGVAQGKLLAQVLSQTIEMGTTRTAFDETAANSNTAYYRNGAAYYGYGAGSSSAAYFYDTTTHVAIDGQVNINAISDVFGSDGVKAANQALQRMIDPKGRKIAIRPTSIICHSTLWQEVQEFLRGSMRYDTIEPTTNIWQGLRAVSTPYLSSETRWFFGAPEKASFIKWVERPTTIARTGLTDANFERRVVQSFRHNMWFGAFHANYRYLISCGYSGQ